MRTLPTFFHRLRIPPCPFVLLLWLGLDPVPGMAPGARAAELVRAQIREGYCWITFATEAGVTYRVEASTDLIAWASVADNVPGDGNAVQILDPEPVPDQSSRFYRIVRFARQVPGEPPGNPDPSQWAWIGPGTFTMGSAAGATGAEADEGALTTVVLSKGLWVGRREVTQAEYQALMGGNPAWFADDLNRPVENVTWLEATNYCARLTAREEASGRLPAGYGYRLPTEAEWEYACRAGSTAAYSYGEDARGTGLEFYAWYWDNSGSTNAPGGFAYSIGGRYFTTQPAGTRQPNRWGLYDLYGNVWEWCLDWYQSAYAGGTLTHPTGAATGSYRVIRGGSWNSGAASCRSANRSASAPGLRSSGIGFRAVLAPNS